MSTHVPNVAPVIVEVADKVNESLIANCSPTGGEEILLEPNVPLIGPLSYKTPLVGWELAEQLALVPPFDPVQFQDQGPEPLTVVAVPALQRFEVGEEVNVAPLLLPHTPLVGWGALAEQLAFVPPFDPAQVQFHGPEPLTVVGFPVLQRFVVGADVKVTPLVLPQVPLTGWMLMEKIVPALLLPPNQVIPYIVEPDTTRLPQGLVPSLATVPSSNECKML